MADSATPDFAMPFSRARWIDVVARDAACPWLAPEILLHAGPPFRGHPPAPVMNAAVQAMLFEGLAADAAGARTLIARHAVQLRPAQDYRVATPLAQVVSASMLLFVVEQRGEICHAPIIEGPAPALRFGSSSSECLSRLRDVGAWTLRNLAPQVRASPVAIDALIRVATAGGDECHARTAVANEALIAGMRALDSTDAGRLRAMPAFVLPLLMAAACTAMRNARSEIEAIGGNGADFGVRRRGALAWHQSTAQAPRGVRFDGMDAVLPLAAIGDSAVVDFCGLGGQALPAAPALLNEWSAVLPADLAARRDSLIDPLTGIVDAARVENTGLGPLINLAIIDRGGEAGLIGRGLYCPPAELFAATLRTTRVE
jgi:hypothetical protein